MIDRKLKEEILSLRFKHYSIEEIIEVLKVPLQTVVEVLTENCVYYGKGTAYNLEIDYLYKNGFTQQQIADVYGVSKQSITYRLAKYGTSIKRHYCLTVEEILKEQDRGLTINEIAEKKDVKAVAIQNVLKKNGLEYRRTKTIDEWRVLIRDFIEEHQCVSRKDIIKATGISPSVYEKVLNRDEFLTSVLRVPNKRKKGN